jgi:hypothetical protein
MPMDLSESDIRGVTRSVHRNLAYGVSLDVALRAALITEFGSPEQFDCMMQELDRAARASALLASVTRPLPLRVEVPACSRKPASRNPNFGSR